MAGVCDKNQISEEEITRIRQEVENDFIKLRDKIYDLLPPDCPLKSGGGLALCMVGLLHSVLLDEHFYVRDDICMQCNIELCPWYNKISHRWLRTLKIKASGFWARLLKNPLTKFLNKTR